EIDNIPDYIFPGLYDSYRPICNGDFNGDGCDDLILSQIEGEVGVLDIFFGSQDLDFVLDTLAVENSYLGTFPIYCNINNDNYDDIMTMGDPYNQLIFIFYGGNTIPNQPDIIIPANSYHPLLLQWGCNLGDFNGDGNNDILINNGEPYTTATIYTMEISQSSDDEVASYNSFLLKNYPNPFKPSGAGRSPGTTISYELPVNVENPVIEIFNIKGEKIRSLCAFPNPDLSGGTRCVVWDGTDNYQNQVSSGVYLYRLKSDEGVLMSKKMLLLK
ncbi:MAG: hypothetical protein KAW88_03080, partial [Candidatus Cloacimonetes bacterium]|nr:hypothetical protein [Candidatus Cloacimonadota bacterium]